MARRAKQSESRPDEGLFDPELVELPPEARWREWMNRIEAVLFASPRPVERPVLVRSAITPVLPPCLMSFPGPNGCWPTVVMMPTGFALLYGRRGITPCIPSRKSRNKTVKYDKRRYKRRNRIEIMLGLLKDWWRVASTGIISGATAALDERPASLSAITALSFADASRSRSDAYAIPIIGQVAVTRAAVLVSRGRTSSEPRI